MPCNKNSPMPFQFIDLFSGIGGMRLGLEHIGGQCLWSCERDKFARLTYQANFPDDTHPFPEDITDVDLDTIPDHHVLAAGFPCQPFSIAGVSKKNALGRPHGFDCNDQGNLFFTIAEILARKQPPVFLLENVKNLKTHNGGHTFTTIKTILENLNYDLHYTVINAKPWTPQNRERIFLVGFHKTAPHHFSFDDLRIPPKQDWPTLTKVLHTKDVLPKYTLSNGLWAYLQAYREKHARLGHGFGYSLVGPTDTARTLSARYHKDGSEILIRQGEGNPRRLTPRECARLMGFPDTFAIPVSDTQAYRQFGNSVVVPVVKAIAGALQQGFLLT